MPSGWWVDWDDPPYPEIRPIETAPEGTESLTLKAAKTEIVQRAREERQHWLAIINHTKAMTVAKLLKSEKGR